MPYIITTRPAERSTMRALDYIAAKGSATATQHLERADGVTRRAVATLEEARESIESRSARNGIATVDAHTRITESGGTIGPLPDGTVLEVERVTDGRMIDLAGFAHYATQDIGRAIDAYNTAHGDA